MAKNKPTKPDEETQPPTVATPDPVVEETIAVEKPEAEGFKDRAYKVSGIKEPLIKVRTGRFGGIRFKTTDRNQAIELYCKHWRIKREDLTEAEIRVEYLVPNESFKPEKVVEE